MKLCNAEVIKKIKELEEKKQEILLEEQQNCVTRYQSEADKIESGYDFETTRKTIEDLNKQIMKFKHALNFANATVVVEEFNLTVGECLVYMAQLNNERLVLERMSRINSKSRMTVFNGTVEYTVTNYDVNVCKSRLDAAKENVTKLQLAIDRVNLNNMIEL